MHSQSELRQLFGALCKGDVLLLEDIDTAGIRREDMQAETFEIADQNETGSNDKTRERQKKPGITLAGLLDAIDTARESGVLLIMTTNRPETLDPALIRAGRIDKEIVFGKVSKEIVGKIFQRMYKESREEPDFYDLVQQIEICNTGGRVHSS